MQLSEYKSKKKNSEASSTGVESSEHVKSPETTLVEQPKKKHKLEASTKPGIKETKTEPNQQFSDSSKPIESSLPQSPSVHADESPKKKKKKSHSEKNTKDEPNNGEAQPKKIKKRSHKSETENNEKN